MCSSLRSTNISARLFEELAREFVVGMMAKGDIAGLDVGSWWSSHGKHEIDIVAMDKKRVTAIGTVKWRAAPLGRDVYKNLAEHARALGVNESIPWLMIGRGGVQPELLCAESHVIGFSIDALENCASHFAMGVDRKEVTTTLIRRMEMIHDSQNIAIRNGEETIPIARAGWPLSKRDEGHVRRLERRK